MEPSDDREGRDLVTPPSRRIRASRSRRLTRSWCSTGSGRRTWRGSAIPAPRRKVRG